MSFSAVGLPDGVDIDSLSGVISGTVAENALQSTPYAVTVIVDDSNGGTATTTFNWIVNDSALSVQATTITPTEGTNTGSVTIATFTNTDPNWIWFGFSATIN